MPTIHFTPQQCFLLYSVLRAECARLSELMVEPYGEIRQYATERHAISKQCQNLAEDALDSCKLG